MKKMIPKETIISELKLKSLETKNENNWNEQTIFYFPPFYKGIINFSLAKLDDTTFSHIKTIIESKDSLDKTARKHLEENWGTDERKDIWDALSAAKRIKQGSVYLNFIIFYSDFTFRIKYGVSGDCKEEICPKYYYIGFNFTKDLTVESMFSEIFPVHLKFDFMGYPLLLRYLFEQKECKISDIDRITKEISEFNGEYRQSEDDNSTGQNIYALCPQNKSVCITVSLDKLRPHYNAHAKYAQKNIPVDPAKQNERYGNEYFEFKDAGVLRTNNVYPIRWLKKHNQENSGFITIPVKNTEPFFINCEIQNYKILKMEIIKDADACKKLETDIYKEDKP